jgi:hypothetical protein
MGQRELKEGRVAVYEIAGNRLYERRLKRADETYKRCAQDTMWYEEGKKSRCRKGMWR